MKTEEKDKSELTDLRLRAEDELKKRTFSESIFEIDNLKLIHELEVHQIELEMQNEELIIARNLAESAMEKYTDLYDFAPSGYLTISEEGEITDLNFSASNLLDKDRKQLKNTRFGIYIHPESMKLYNQTLEKVFEFKTKKSCELFLQSKKISRICVHIDAIVSENTNLCLLTMIDISERKQMEQEILEKSKQYEDLNRYFMDRELRMIDLKHEINDLLLKSGCEKEYLI